MGQRLLPLSAVRMTSRFDPTVSFSRAQQMRRLVCPLIGATVLLAADEDVKRVAGEGSLAKNDVNAREVSVCGQVPHGTSAASTVAHRVVHT